MTDRIKHFRYVARDRDGKLVKGVIYANSKEECSVQLRSKKLYLTELKRVVLLKGGWLSRRRNISYTEVGIFCKQFSTLLKAGIAIPQALQLMSYQKTSLGMQEMVSNILKSLEQGESLYQGFSHYQEKFPPFFCLLIRAGETTNSLDLVFERLAIFYDQEDQFRKQLVQLMVYPFILIISTIGVIAFLFLKIIPDFSEIYESFEATLPFLTYCLMAISRHLSIHFKKYLIGFPLCIFFLSYIYNIPKVKNWFIRFQYVLPIWGKIKKKFLTSRLARTWSLLLTNGLEVLPTVELTIGTVDYLVNQYLQQVVVNVKQGMSLVRALRSVHFFPNLFLEMVEIGEESGALSVMLLRIAEIYENEGRNQIQRFLTMLEPILLLGIAVIVGIIILAVMLPMFDLIKVF